MKIKWVKQGYSMQKGPECARAYSKRQVRALWGTVTSNFIIPLMEFSVEAEFLNRDQTIKIIS